MTQRVIYIADDGEEFETEEECTAYEKCKAGLPGILGFDDDGVYQDPNETDIGSVFFDSQYVFITNAAQAVETLKFIQDHYGYEVPTMFQTGDLMHYNGEEDEWENALDKYISSTEMLTTLFESVRNAALNDEVCAVNTAMQKIRQAVYELLI